MLTELRKVTNALKNAKGSPSLEMRLETSTARTVILKATWFSKIEGLKFCAQLMKDANAVNLLASKPYSEDDYKNFPVFFSMLDEANLDIFTSGKTVYPDKITIRELIVSSGGKDVKIPVSAKVIKKGKILTPMAQKLVTTLGF